MAIFNPDVPDVSSDYTRNSQGYASDKSLSGLFESGANLFQTAVEGADKLFKKVVRDESTKQVDIERDRELDRGAAKMRGDLPPPGVRGPIDATAQNLETMKRANASGQIGDSHYQIALDAASRRMRERYPGHREYIDNVFQDLTGHTPANQAIQLMKAELNKEGKDAERLNELHYARDKGVESVVKAMADGSVDKIPTATLRTMNAQHGYITNKIANDKHSYELDNVQDANSQRKVLDRTQGLFLESLTARQRDIQTVTGATWDRVQGLKTQAIEAGEAGKPVPKEVEQQLGLAINKYKDEEMTKAADFLKDKITIGGKEVTRGEAMSTKNVDDYFKAVQMQLDKTTDLKNFKQNAAFNDATKDANLADLLFSHEAVGRAHAFIQQVSPQVANTLAMGSGTALKSYQETMLQYVFHKLPGKSDFGSDLTEVGDSMRNAGKSEKEIAETEQESIYRMTNALKTPGASPKDLDNLVRKLYGGGGGSKDFYANASQVQKEALFTKMIDPGVTEAVFRTSNPNIIQTYRGWVDRVVGDRLDQGAKDIKYAIADKESRYAVKYSPENQNFEVVDKGIGRPGRNPADHTEGMRVQSVVNGLNRTVAHYTPVADKLSLTPEKRDLVMQKIFRLNKIDLSTMKVIE